MQASYALQLLTGDTDFVQHIVKYNKSHSDECFSASGMINRMTWYTEAYSQQL